MSNRDDTRLSCDDVRSLVFDARAADDRETELSGERRAGFDRHLEDCSACREYVDQVDGMLGGAAEADPTDWATRDADETFDAIMNEVEREGGDEETPADGGATIEFWPRSYYAAAGLAAGIALTIAGLWAWRHLGADTTGPTGPERSRVVENDEAAGVGPEKDPDPRSEPGQEADLDELAAAEEDEQGLDLYASPGASWEITDRNPVTVRLDAGTILVEYLPTDSEGMRVQTGDAEIRVTGTVFYVATDGARTSTGVAEGSVEVEVPERETSVGVEAGQRLGSDYRVEPMSDRERTTIDARVDLEKHRAELEANTSGTREPSEEDDEAGERTDREAAAPSRATSDRETDREPSERRDRTAPSETTKSVDETGTDERGRPDVPDPVADLRRQARAAMKRKDFEAAARSYEAMLDRLPVDHEAAPSVHLDVARVYLRYLERPEAAADHLRTFVTRRPEDPAAESAREELCRIAADSERDESLCDGAEGERP